MSAPVSPGDSGNEASYVGVVDELSTGLISNWLTQYVSVGHS